ncbi:MAG: hypothetical protein N3A02_04270, partial [Rectinema sp.]|nr:hypothetical protein [Rectinema sp.]
MRLFLFPIMCLLVVVFSSGTAVAENSGFSVNGYGVVIDAPSGTLLARQIIAGVVTVSYDADVDNNTRNTIRDTLQQIRDRGMVVEAAWSIVADPQEIQSIANDAAAAFNQTYVTTWLRYDGQSRRLLGPYPGVTFILQRDPSVCIAEIYMPAERVGGNSEATCGYWYHQLKDGAIFEEESMVLHRTDISDSWFSNPNTVSMLTLFNHYNDLGRSGTERMVIPGMVVVPPGTGSTPVVSWDAQAQAWSLPSNAKIRFLAGSDGRQEVVCIGYPSGYGNRKVVRYAGRSFVQQGTLRAEGPTSIPPEAYRVIDNHETETGDCGYVRVKVRLNNNQEEVRYIPDTISGFVWQGRRDPFRSWRRIYTAEEVGVEDVLPGQRMIVGYFTRTRHEGKISFRVSESEAIRYDLLPRWAKDIEDSRQGAPDLVESLQQMQDQAARSHLKVYTDTTAPERSPTTTRLFLKSMRAMNVERDRRDQDWIGLQTSMSGESTVSFTPSAATPQGYSSGPSAPLATTMSSFHKTYATSQELQRAQEAFNAMRNAIQQDQKALAEQVLLATPQSQDVAKPATRPDYGTWAPGMPTARPRPRRTMSLDEAMRITANRVAQEAEGGQKITANLQDFKKAFIKPAGLLPQDITPPWSTTENVDTTSPDFLGGGDGDNPWIGRPEIVWRTFGLPFYDHDGDGDLDRYGSSDPFDSGYTHLRIRWHLLPETFFIRTGITAGLKSWATQMGFTKKFRPVDDMDKLGHQACFSVAGLRVRRDGSIKSQDILFWGNDTTFTFKRQEKKKKAGVTVSRKWFYGPSLENMLVRAAPGTSQQDPDSHNTWIFRLLYAGEATNSEAVRSPEVEPLRSIPAVQQTWYKTRENNIEGETTEATHPHIVYIHSGLPYKLYTITESATMNPELPIEEDTSTYAEEGVGIAANFVPLSTSNPPKMLVDGTQRAVATTYTRIIEYYDATGNVERRETKKYYYPGTALRYTIYVYDAGSERRTEVVEEIVIDVINRTQSEINNDANADADDTEAPAENKGQWVNAATGQPVPANDFQSQWLASKGWSAPRYATTITVFRGEVQTTEAARNLQQEKIGTYRYDRVQTDAEEQQRQNPVIEQGDELWVWGVNGVLNRDLNGDGQINHLDDGVLLSRLQAASGASNNAVVMSQIAELVEKFTRYYQAGNNPVIFAQEAISMLQTSENAAVAAGVLIAVGPLYLLEQIVYVWISNVIVRFEQTLWDQAPEAMAVLYAVATVAAFFGAPLAIAFLAFMAQMYLYKYVIGPVISLFTTILFSAFNKANPLKPLQEKDPEGWNRLPWFVKRQTVYGPGSVQLNPNRDAIPGP